STRDGAFDGEALRQWLEQVKAACTASGHLEVALSRVGYVLVYSPPDPDGLGVHRSAAVELNAKDASDRRDGFVTELFNSRGAFRQQLNGIVPMVRVAIRELNQPHGSAPDAPCPQTTSPASAARTPTVTPTAGGAGTTSSSSTTSARPATGCSTAGPAERPRN